MSAFICHNEHIKTLALYWGLNDTRGSQKSKEQIQETADIFFNENVRSVQCRYPNSAPDDLPGAFNLKPPHITNRDLMYRKVTDPVHILKMCRCLEYQSCETDDWETTKAHKLLHETELVAIWNLPGIDEIPWEFQG